ncbi:hypothetical protein Tco_0213351 [Tanacetum coccineum]
MSRLIEQIRLDARSNACIDMKLIREANLAEDLSKLMLELLVSVKERESFIEELKFFRGNLVAYKTMEKLKNLQKDDLMKVMKLRIMVSELQRQIHKEVDFYHTL